MNKQYLRSFKRIHSTKGAVLARCSSNGVSRSQMTFTFLHTWNPHLLGTGYIKSSASRDIGRVLPQSEVESCIGGSSCLPHAPGNKVDVELLLVRSLVPISAFTEAIYCGQYARDRLVTRSDPAKAPSREVARPRPRTTDRESRTAISPQKL